MTTTAIVTMVLICGLVWGGFALLLVRAVRRESSKNPGAPGRYEGGSGSAVDGQSPE